MINLNHNEPVVTGHNKTAIANFLSDGCAFFAGFIDTMKLCNPKEDFVPYFRLAAYNCKPHPVHDSF